MSFSLKILGTSSAIPAFGRNQSAQVLQVYNNYYLIDCGEGTQNQLKKNRVNINKIHSVFISHLHGDHFLGLFGLISTMSLLGRDNPLNIYGPKGLDEIITTQLKYSESILKFEVNFHTTSPTESVEICNQHNISVTSFPLNHRIDCTGFLFKEISKPMRINPEVLPSVTLSNSELKQLKEGKDIYSSNGDLKHKNSDLTLPPKKCRSFAYCSDTTYFEPIIPIIEGCDLLYHEATFIDKHKDRSVTTFHSTAKQAATIAQKAAVHQLIIGHYSSRYKEIADFRLEAQTVFENTILAEEGMTIEVPQ